MVVIGTYPYQHSITLDLLCKSTGEKYLYYVDEDKIVKESDLPKESISIDNVYHIAYGEDVGRTIDAYRSQLIPIPEPKDRKMNTQYEEDMKKLKQSSICLINNMCKDTMVGIGGVWNQSLACWIVDAEHLSLLKDRRMKKYDGKVYKAPYIDTTYKVWGDLSQHVEKLKSIGAIYNEEEDFWVVKLSMMGKIASIFK